MIPVHGADDRDEGRGGVRGAGADVDADDDERVLLDAEAARVEVEGELAEREAPSGQFLPGAAEGEDEELGDDVADGQRGVSEGKELIGAGENDDKNRKEEPGAEGCEGGQELPLTSTEGPEGTVFSLLHGMLGSSVLGTQAATSGTEDILACVL